MDRQRTSSYIYSLFQRQGCVRSKRVAKSFLGVSPLSPWAQTFGVLHCCPKLIIGVLDWKWSGLMLSFFCFSLVHFVFHIFMVAISFMNRSIHEPHSSEFAVSIALAT